MTRLLLLFALLLLAHLPCSAYPDAHNALIRGTVRGTTAGMAYVGYYESALHNVFSRTTLDSAPISGGRFSVAMQLNHGVTWYLKIGDAFVTYDKFIAPGDTLRVEYSRSGKSETVVLGGNHEDGNDLLADHQSRFYSGSALESYQASFGTMEPGAFASYIDARYADELRFVHERLSAGRFPDEFRRHILAEVRYRWASDRLQYVWRYARAHKGASDPSIWAGYYGFLDTLVTAEPRAPGSMRYVQFIREYAENLYRRWGDSMTAAGSPPDRARRNVDELRLVANTLRGPALDVARLWCIESQLRFVEEARGQDTVKYGAIIAAINSDFADMMRQFTDGAAHPDDVRELNAEVEYRLTMSKGSPAPEFALKDLNGARVSLSSLRGKPVYIDFWATNCAPCLQEMRNDVPSLQRRFGDSVYFVYVSLDGSDRAWRSFVARSGVKGIHVNEPAGLASAVARAYRIAGIPRHVLLDSAGRIVSADAAGADRAADLIAPLVSR